MLIQQLIAEFLFVKLERRELTIFAFRFVNRLFTNFKQWRIEFVEIF